MTKLKFPQLSNKRWLLEEISKKPLRQIAEEVGCSYSAVCYQSRKFKINVPRRFKRRVFETKSISQKAAHKKKWPDGRLGEQASNWRGGRTTSPAGYIWLHLPNHHRASNGRVFEHIIVAEEKLGRPIGRNEIVHHINHIKDDNRPENLVVMTRGEHVSGHFKEGDEAARYKAILDKHKIAY